ncbi:MAG: SMODS domain-containing nucleotidyltransferase [Plesiomonas shigelloides]
MATQDHFNKFYKAIKLTREDDAYSGARTKDDSILADIRSAFKDAGYPIIDNFLQGSFSTHTAIRSKNRDFDIDRALVIDAEKAPNNPVDCKKVVLETLERRGFKNAKIKKPCVTADYANLNLHIDFPIYSKSGEIYKLAVGKLHSDENNREWSESDPKGLKTWINSKEQYFISPDATQQQFLRLVCYLKRWRDECFEDDVRRKIFSIGLTVMVKNCLQPQFDNDGKPQDLLALKNTVQSILDSNYFSPLFDRKYKVRVPLPVCPWRDIFDGSSTDTGTQLFNKLTRLHDKLNAAADEQDEVQQCTILNQQFGDDFVVPESSKKANAAATLAAYPSAGVVGTSQGA